VTIFDQPSHGSDACFSGEGSDAMRVEQQAKCREAKLYGEVWESDASLGGPYFVHVRPCLLLGYLRGWEGIISYPEISPIGCLLVWVLRG
jgi:hypothetical protein